MNNTEESYLFYLNADRVALKKDNLNLKNKIKLFIYPDYIWDFEKSLRKFEYLKNKANKNLFDKMRLAIAYGKYRRSSLKLGFSIPANVFGPGLSIAHYGTIVVNSNAKIGKNCRLHICVNIGASGGKPEAPILGDNIYIGPGAKLFGAIKIANNTVIAANSVVNKSFLEENTIIGGVPAKVIRKLDSEEIKAFIPYL